MTSTQKTIWSIVGILALIGIGFYVSYKAQAPVVDDVGYVDTNDTASPITVNVKHQYKGGKNIVAGELDLPTPCHKLQTVASVNNAANVAMLAFTASSTAKMCAQVISTQAFKVEFGGAPDVTLQGTFNNKPLNLNVFEVPADENIDTFEIYTKG